MPDAAPSSSWVIPRSSRMLRSSVPNRSCGAPAPKSPTVRLLVSRRTQPDVRRPHLSPPGGLHRKLTAAVAGGNAFRSAIA
ncbi:hypothetical protein GCM10009663_08770 [Kitasatospora arboriphila]|uniref:Uncharacterized protein n=1 Tax=Kitasatospora arboriphila TaxID=258052 RepID=A0ABP4DUT7_9ACTN